MGADVEGGTRWYNLANEITTCHKAVKYHKGKKYNDFNDKKKLTGIRNTYNYIK